ncbi:MAG: hypothetical protein ACRDL1_07450 [Solirubrobacterales bacterium]
MERVAWTDERLDDFSRRVDARFDQVDHRLDRLEARLDDGLGGIRAEIGELRSMFVRIGGGVIVGLVGVIAAVISTG